jgi:hypothetical protein
MAQKKLASNVPQLSKDIPTFVQCEGKKVDSIDEEAEEPEKD